MAQQSMESFAVWDWLSWKPEAARWQKETCNKAQSIARLGFTGGAELVFNEPGIHFCFLPKVKNLKINDEALCAHLSKCMDIPSMFWEQTGWDSNGFFWARPSIEQEAMATVSRLLLKEVTYVKDKELSYAWIFFGFASRWSAIDGKPGEYSTVFLIFDCAVKDTEEDAIKRRKGYADKNLDENAIKKKEENARKEREEDALTFTMMDDTANHLKNRQDVASLHREPFGAYILLLEPVLRFYDSSLWGFRVPVRDYEKNRLAASKGDTTVYNAMHELSRHIIHATETLQAAENVLAGISASDAAYNKRRTRAELSYRPNKAMDMVHSDQASTQSTTGNDLVHEDEAVPTMLQHASHDISTHQQAAERPHSSIFDQVRESLSFYHSRFAALQLRADAFDKRLQNEIKLAHHSVIAQETKTQESILQGIRGLQQEMKDDSKQLARLVSYLTVSFLPGSFFTGFFGMNVLSFSPTDDTSESTYWELSGWQISHWIFLPVSVIIVSTIICWIMVTAAGLLSFLRPKVPEIFKTTKGDGGESGAPKTQSRNSDTAVVTT